MKLERQKDIPAFKGKGWRERFALRNQAWERDPWILRLHVLGYFLIMMPTLFLSQWIVDLVSPHSSLFSSSVITGVTVMVLGCPVLTLFDSLFIVPRIRKALEDPKPLA